MSDVLRISSLEYLCPSIPTVVERNVSKTPERAAFTGRELESGASLNPFARPTYT